MKKILTLGSATQDIFIDYEGPQAKKLEDSSLQQCSFLLVAEGCKIEVKNLIYATGGGATNSAVSFKRLGFDVTSFFQIGNDTEGSYIINDLTNSGIKVLPLNNAHEKTGRSFILPSPSGNHPILAYRGANAFIEEKNLPLHALKNFDALYITSLSGKSSSCLKVITEEAHTEKIFVATNPGKSQLAAGAEKIKPSLGFINAFICNTTESEHLMHALYQHNDQQEKKTDSSLPELLQRSLQHKTKFCSLNNFFTMMHELGPEIVVVTNGAEGVYVSDGKTIYFQKSPSIKVISTVGAGDAFASCFIGNILQGATITESLKYATLNAVSVIQHLCAKKGLLSQKQLQKELHLNILEKTLEFKL